MKRPIGLLTTIIGVLILGGGLAALLWPKPTDPLCQYVNSVQLECLALIADRDTYRPGAITRVTADAHDAKLRRVELPLSYLDNESCIIPGASLTALPTKPAAPFGLPAITYSSAATARMGGTLAQGLQVNLGPASKRIEQIELSFGSAHTELLDQNLLLERINSCAIREECVNQILSHHYRVINRVLEVDDIDYAFKDEKGGSISIHALEKVRAITVGGAFDLDTKAGVGLRSTYPSIIGVSLIDDGAIRSAVPCRRDVQYLREGEAQVQIGGGGGEGHIAGDIATTQANLGETAALSQYGAESKYGNFDQTQSFAAASASVNNGDTNNSIVLALSITSHGGHYGQRGPLGLGIISGADTSADASAQATGRINVLLRRAAARLRVSWAGFPKSLGSGKTALSSMVLYTPSGAVLQRFNVTSGDGRQEVLLPSEGQYALIGSIELRAETNGSAGKASSVVNANVTAQALTD